MTKPSTRDIVVKMLVNPDEFLAFEKTCAAHGHIPHSVALRSLVSAWIQPLRDRSSTTRRREWPGHGHERAMFPGRAGRAAGAPIARMRL